jgi:hypothetical protein
MDSNIIPRVKNVLYDENGKIEAVLTEETTSSDGTKKFALYNGVNPYQPKGIKYNYMIRRFAFREEDIENIKELLNNPIKIIDVEKLLKA